MLWMVGYLVGWLSDCTYSKSTCSDIKKYKLTKKLLYFVHFCVLIFFFDQPGQIPEDKQTVQNMEYQFHPIASKKFQRCKNHFLPCPTVPDAEQQI